MIIQEVTGKMVEELFEKELRFFRETIREVIAPLDLRLGWPQQARDVAVRLERLAHDDRALFQRISVSLLQDEQYEIRLGTLKLLTSCHIRDNALSTVVVQMAREQRNLREDALLALWQIGTYFVLPQ